MTTQMPISQARPHPMRAKWRRSSLKATSRKEAVGGGGLPRDVGRRVRCARRPVLGVKAMLDSVAQVL